MKIHEYQAKEILRAFGVPTPRGRVAATVDEAVAAWRDLGGRVAVKAQIHAGGRGKGGGIALCASEADVRREAGRILGMTLVTPQTGPEGRRVKKVLVEEVVEIEREFYAAAMPDRAARRVVVIASASGGMAIEEVAARDPKAILRHEVDPFLGIQPHEGRAIAGRLGLRGRPALECAKVIVGIARALEAKDASLVEVNPLALLGDGRVVAADAKMNFDENALFRHPDVEALRDLDEEDPQEREAKEANLSFVNLPGNIGCIVNGAGLAMATMDVIQHFGGEPANFLDIGGSAKADRVAKAFRILLADRSVRAIFVNVFGGIVRCDEVAKGIVAAAREVGLDRPLIIRLTGTNEEEGRRILAGAGYKVGTSMAEAARAAVEAAR